MIQGEEKLLVAGSSHKLNLGEYDTVLFSLISKNFVPLKIKFLRFSPLSEILK